MTIEHMSTVFDLDLESTQKFVLLCLADNADQDGICFPSVTTLCRKTSMSERTVQRALRQLFDSGVLQSFYQFTNKVRHKKIRHFRLALAGVLKAPRPNYENCPRELRAEVIDRFACTCQYCGMSGDDTNGPDGSPWHVDRILSGSRGGLYIADNVTLACRKCNSSKGAKLAPEEVVSLGAKLAEEGCHSDPPGVSNTLDAGATMAPESLSESSWDPSGKPQAAKRGSRTVPADWTPLPGLVQAIQCDPKCAGVDIERELAKMRNFTFKSPHKDWPKTFYNWCLTAGGGKTPAKVDATGKPDTVRLFVPKDDGSGELDMQKFVVADLKPWEQTKLAQLRKQFKSKTIFYRTELNDRS